MAHPAFWGLAVAAGELALGILLLLGGRRARIGWVGLILFQGLLVLFGWGFLLWSLPGCAAPPPRCAPRLGPTRVGLAARPQNGHMSADQSRRRRETDPRTGADAVEARIQQQETWVDLQLRQAVARGDFHELPGFGKPLTNLTGDHDPDWWVKQLIEREQITGVLPPSLQVRKEDAELEGRLDALATEAQVRREVEEFNARVRWALYRPPEGPPVVTRPRHVDHEVAQWRERRAARRARRAIPTAAAPDRRRESRLRRAVVSRLRHR